MIHRVGTATVQRIEDMPSLGFPATRLIPDWNNDAVPPELATGEIHLSIHAWLVRDRGRTILIDTGAGNDKDRPLSKYFDHLNTPFLDRLAKAGVLPEQVDLVLLTHLHVDHVGWNTRLVDGAWVPTFPRARYLFSRAESAYFTDPANLNERNRTSFAVHADSVAPVIAAGLAEPIEADGREVADGFSFFPTPGHTMHHASIAFRSGDETALFPGDVVHHPAQVFRPSWNSSFDAFPDPARASRRSMLERAADHGESVFTSHFGGSSAGRVARADDAFAWQSA